jgi:hypothetical protein
MALPSSAATQAAVQIIDDRAEVRDQMRLLVVYLSDELANGLVSAAPRRRRNRAT